MPPSLPLSESAKKLLQHKFTDETSKEYEGTEFGGFGKYIANKVIKLQNQAQQAINDSVNDGEEEQSNIFRGCIIYVTGYTQPSIFELKRLITLNGGIHAQYLNGKTSVTHIVASSLTPRKRQEFAQFKVVRPEWIVESVKNKKLLAWSDYRTIQVKSTVVPPKFVIPKQLVSRSDGISSTTTTTSSSKSLFKSPRTSPSRSGNSLPQHAGLKLSPVKVPEKFKPVATVVDAFPSNAVESKIELSSKRPRSDDGDDGLEDDLEIQKWLQDPETKRQKKGSTNLNDKEGEESDSETQPEYDIDLEQIIEQHNDKEMPYDPNESVQYPQRRIDCLDPDFIPSYYRNSRLHHLSIWKADLRRKFLNLAKEQNSRASSPMSSSSTIIFHIDYDSFFVAVALLQHPHLRGKPVCVSNGGSANADVASCNYIARKFGVRNGMWISSALKRCPELISVAYDFPAYEKASSALYDTLLEFKPDILYPVSVDEALIDITSSFLNVLDDEKKKNNNKAVDAATVNETAVMNLASRLRNRIREVSGLEASIGAGPNVLLAKVALRLAKPSGQKYISESKAAHTLDDVLIEDLPGIGRHISNKIMEKFKIRFVGQIRSSCKKTDLEALIGNKVGAKLYDYAFGLDDTDISIISGPKSIGVEIAWGIRLQNEQEVDKFLSNLALELCQRMDRSNMKGKTLILKIFQRAADEPREPPKYMGCGVCDIYSKTQVLETVTSEHKVITPVIQNLIRTFGCPWMDLRGVGIQMKLEDEQDESNNNPDNTRPDRNQSTISQAMRGEREQQTDVLLPVEPIADDQEEVSPSKKIRKKMQLIPIMPRPRRNHTTFTQLSSKIDINVLNELPADIRREILDHAGLSDSGRYRSSRGGASRLPRPTILTLSGYIPIDFFGRISAGDIRNYVIQWIESTMPSGLPHYDDVCVFEKYIFDVIEKDSNWSKIVNLLQWMNRYVKSMKNSGEWVTLVEIYTRIAQYKLLDRRGIRVVI